MKHYLFFSWCVVFFVTNVGAAVTKLKAKCGSCKAYIGPQGPQGPQGIQGPAGTDATSDNFLFVNDSMAQGMGMSGVFQNVTFDTVQEIDGWTPVSGNVEFTCAQTALYYISYTATVSNTTSDTGTVEFVMFAGGVQIPASRVVSGMASTNTPLVVYHNFFTTITAGQNLKMQIKASQDTIQLQANSAGTTAPSVSLAVVRIK